MFGNYRKGESMNLMQVCTFDGRVVVFTGFVNQQHKYDRKTSKVTLGQVNIDFAYPIVDNDWPIDNHNYTYR